MIEASALFAAALSAVATIAAAIAAWRVPRTSAILAERMRREAEERNEARRMKLYVFTTVMQERASVFSAEAVRALNLIDVVYNDSNKVREAWAELHSAFGDPQASGFDRQNKLRNLLKEMSLHLGLSDQLRTDDISRVYYPNSLAEEEEIRILERRAALERYRGEGADVAYRSPYPPKPQAQ